MVKTADIDLLLYQGSYERVLILLEENGDNLLGKMKRLPIERYMGHYLKMYRFISDENRLDRKRQILQKIISLIEVNNIFPEGYIDFSIEDMKREEKELPKLNYSPKTRHWFSQHSDKPKLEEQIGESLHRLLESNGECTPLYSLMRQNLDTGGISVLATSIHKDFLLQRQRMYEAEMASRIDDEEYSVFRYEVRKLANRCETCPRYISEPRKNCKRCVSGTDTYYFID